MKIWLKTALAAAAGLLIGILLSRGGGELAELLPRLSRVALQIGRYAVFPVVFFGVVMSTHELRSGGAALRVYGRLALYVAGSSALLTAVGLASVLLLAPQRIPIVVIVEHSPRAAAGLIDIVGATFPGNLFQALVNDGSMLLPLLALGLILGAHLDFDDVVRRPVTELFDSLCRIFFQINALVVELFWVAIVVIAAAAVVQLGHAELALYRELIVVLAVDVTVLYLGVFPALLYLLGERTNPYRAIYAALGPALTGLISGDPYVSLGSLVVHGRESFRLPRRVTAAVYPLCAVFGRAGSALVTGIGYLMVLRSYTSFEITVEQLLWAALFTFLLSFVAGAVPGLGAMVSLTLLWSLSGNGLADGPLIMQPVLPLLTGVAVLLDVTTAALIAHLVARDEAGPGVPPARLFT